MKLPSILTTPAPSAALLIGPGLVSAVAFARHGGVPVVTSNASSMPEVAGEAALYVNPHDPADIAQKVVQAVEDLPLREGLIQKGFARAREFTWRRTAEATLAVYEEVLNL